MLIALFITIQSVLLAFMALHDWVHLPPLTNIRDLEKEHSVRSRLISSLLNTLFVVIPLGLTLAHYPGPFPCSTITHITLFYAFLTLGTVLSWWVPYMFGSSAKHKQGFIEYKNTHHFLPAKGDNIIPNTFHCILHLLVWTSLGISLYLMNQYCL